MPEQNADRLEEFIEDILGVKLLPYQRAILRDLPTWEGCSKHVHYLPCDCPKAAGPLDRGQEIYYPHDTVLDDADISAHLWLGELDELG